jgi:hypothetical protein
MKMKLKRFLILIVLLWGTASQASRDFTFFLFSDIHVGAENLKANPPVTREQSIARVKANLDAMRKLVGQPWPVGSKDAISVPRALMILGDVTDGHQELPRQQEQWRCLGELFPEAGVPFGKATVPVFAIAGNHDGPVAGPSRQGLLLRNRKLERTGQLAAISSNGAHYALNWEGVHFLFLNICPADKTDSETPFKFGQAGAGSWNDPEGAFSFLKEYLERRVGHSGEPVVLLQHYGFDGFSLNDWNWWTLKQRCALYDLLKDYNIAAIAHGHNHHAEHYRWPDPKLHAADLDYFFKGKPPASFRQYDVLSCGNVCWVIRVRGDQLFGANFKGQDWNVDSAARIMKSLKP